MSLSKPKKEEFQPEGPGLYLRSNHSRPLVRRELFILELMRGDEVVAHREEATPTLCRLIPEQGDGVAEIVFDGDLGLRLRGQGVGLRFRAATGTKRDELTMGHFVGYSDGEGAFVVNIRPALRRYRFEVRQGDMEVRAPFDREESTSVDLTFGGSTWEFAIEEFWSTYIPSTNRHSFADLIQIQEERWQGFRQAFPSLPQDHACGAELAQYVLWSCTQSPSGQLIRPSVFMSLNWMDQLWSWDNVFNACALAPAAPTLALDQILTFADHQDEHGAYPDGLNDLFKHYNFSKPPVQGLLFDWIEENTPEFWTPERRSAVYNTTARFTRWWLNHRRFEGQRLCHYLHGNDSGWDNTTLLRKGSPIICPDLNAFLVVQCEILANFANLLGQPDEAREWNRKSAELEKALVEELWNGKTFAGVLLSTGERVEAESLVTCMPIVLGQRLPSSVRVALVEQIRSFITEAGLATENPNSPLYEPDGYWRGPMWGPSTFLIVQGLMKSGENELAIDIVSRYAKTCEKSGMAENFDALTGAGLRDLAYTWTASAYLELVRWMDRPA